jgi:ATP synthase assembly factor FMC1, mitochondrial
MLNPLIKKYTSTKQIQTLTAMTTAPSQIRSLYRRLLRELPARSPPQTILSHPSPLQRQVRAVTAGEAPSPAPTASSTSPASPQSSPSLQPTLALLASKPVDVDAAEQFVQYAQAQRKYATLIERYNPGMGMNEEERVRLTARRVGMDLPEELGGGEGKQ